MKLKISTAVEQSHDKVWDGFNEKLFVKLSPPFPKVSLKKFDGCKTGDTVALTLNFILFKQQWVSKIISDEASESHFEFVDVGVNLPFFIKKWKHRHRIEQANIGSVIIDDIEYSTGLKATDIFLYPLFALQFLYRKPVYKRVFKKA